MSIPEFPDYELLDSGGFEKLERFGTHILRRPEPQAVWSKSLNEQEWVARAHASFFRKKGSAADTDQGNWELRKGVPERWHISYHYKGMKLKFRLGLTSFKHVGIFPEQADNWNFIYKTLNVLNVHQPRVLNLFAYTGGASLAARAAGAETYHVDSVRQVISWSRENMELSGLNDIRWIVEDAYRFVERELRRGRSYHGIIMDPPAYGRGPEGEKWQLEKQINELLSMCSGIMEPQNSFLLVNLYSMGFSPMITETLVQSNFPGNQFDSGELFVKDRFGKCLPLGTCLRLIR
ncbi:MAG: class I SAM-dependent methyltransferase [Bacteroidetes bacterium]|nr:class I SAM-dependent methyltransferase [Bacteroidota bacterium]